MLLSLASRGNRKVKDFTSPWRFAPFPLLEGEGREVSPLLKGEGGGKSSSCGEGACLLLRGEGGEAKPEPDEVGWQAQSLSLDFLLLGERAQSCRHREPSQTAWRSINILKNKKILDCFADTRNDSFEFFTPPTLEKSCSTRGLWPTFTFTAKLMEVKQCRCP